MKSSVVSLYLALYNITCCVGWAYILYICAVHWVSGRYEYLWEESNYMLKVVQTAAVFEIFHILLGIVKSSLSTSFLQVFARVVFVWAIFDAIPSTQTSIFTILAISSWALVEVPRYLFYALNLFDSVPFVIFWLRYSLFLVLYVTGITGELGCLYQAANELWDTKGYVFQPIPSLPSLQISQLMMIILLWLMYIPGAPTMYLHMLKNRRKQLRSTQRAKKSI